VYSKTFISFFLLRFVVKQIELLQFLTSAFLLGLCVLAYQDFNERKVTVLLFILLIILGGYIHYTTQFTVMFLFSLMLNFSIVLLLILILLGYVKFVMKKKLSDAIGLGDFLFFGVLSVSFPTVSFILLFCSSLIFSLIVFTILKPKMKIKTVPLAGLQALFLFLTMGINLLLNIVDLYLI